VSIGFLWTDLERAERHVAEYEGMLCAARHAGGVVNHVAQRNRQRGFVSLQHHAERIADQQHVYTLRFEQRGETRVITGQHGNFFALAAHGFQCS
jgi:hypothetical protein